MRFPHVIENRYYTTLYCPFEFVLNALDRRFVAMNIQALTLRIPRCSSIAVVGGLGIELGAVEFLGSNPRAQNKRLRHLVRRYPCASIGCQTKQTHGDHIPNHCKSNRHIITRATDFGSDQSLRILLKSTSTCSSMAPKDPALLIAPASSAGSRTATGRPQSAARYPGEL